MSFFLFLTIIGVIFYAIYLLEDTYRYLFGRHMDEDDYDGEQ